ncbi:MAG: SUMF1/EgtB/PvdO family nonheme iron enzyme [Spirochaetales bacterium]
MNPQPRLKPFFGIPPKTWLAGIYLTVTLTGLFFLVLWNGLAHPGTLWTVTSTPPGAAVLWKQAPLGQTPLTVFLPEGSGELRVAKPSFVPFLQKLDVQNSLFLSLFWPRKASLDVFLQPRSSESVASDAVFNIGSWSLAAPFDETNPFPPLFSTLVADASSVGMSPKAIQDLLLQLRPLVADPQMYADYGRALGLWTDLPPAGLQAQAKLWTPLLRVGNTETTRLVFWVLANQSPDVRKAVLDSGGTDFQALREAWQKSILTLPDDALVVPAKPSQGEVRFVAVSPQWFYWGQSAGKPEIPTERPFRLPVPAQTRAFLIATLPVTRGEFEAFVAANPEWSRARAIELGRADSGYLGSDSATTSATAPVTQVSWWAAQAYVAWLNALGRAPAGQRFALASELEWESAVRQIPTLMNPKKAFWEWTASAYGVADPLVWGQNPVPELPYASYARTLKGGSAPWLRAGAAATATSPVVGFRLTVRTLPPEAKQ